MAITLTQAMRSNLTALQSTNNLMDMTQTRLSTGKKVNTALDDPVNFFKAKSHSDRASDLAAKKDGMKEAIKTIEAANTGIEAIYDLLDQMKSLAQAARTSDDPTALATQYDELIDQIATVATDSKYGGSNLLGDDTMNELTVEFNEDGTNSLTVTGFDASTTPGTIGTEALTADLDFTDATLIDQAITEVDGAIKYLRTQAQSLASNLSTIQIRADFTENMINTLNSGADNLTLADMNEEGANMLMLQTRQQLGISALSMSSQAAQTVLKLF